VRVTSSSGLVRFVNCTFQSNAAVRLRFSFLLLVERLGYFHGAKVGSPMTPQGNGNGGALYYGSNTTRGSLAVLSCLFLSNSVSSGGDLSGAGGALYVYNAAMVLLADSEFSSNDAVLGGGAARLYDVTSVAVTECRFTSNAVSNAHGGALAVYVSPSVVLLDCNFSANNASFNGGAVHLVYVTSVNATGSRFVSNSGSFGGALVVKNATSVGLTECEFASNNAVMGGAVFCEGTVVRVALNRTAFYDNSASLAGGAVFLDATAINASHVSVCDFRGNRVQQTAIDSAGVVGGAGGALYIHQDISDAARTALVRVAQSNFTDNNSSGLGGAMLLLAPSSDPSVVTLEVELAECRFAKSSSGGGGAVYAENIHRLQVNRTVFDSNAAAGGTALGGALLVRRVPEAESSLPRRDDLALLASSNTDTALPPATVALKDCDFLDNALKPDAAANDEIQMGVGNVQVIDSGMRCGAGMAVVASPTTAILLRVVSSRFQGNRATHAFEGGGVCIGGAVEALVEDGAFHNNTAANGGAVAVKHSSTLSVQSTAFSHNTATGDGGAILAVSGASLAAADVQFSFNRAASGAGVYLDASTAATVTLQRLTRAEGNEAVNNELVFAEAPVQCTNCTSTVPALAACERWQSSLDEDRLAVQGPPHAMSVYKAVEVEDSSVTTLKLWGESLDVKNTGRLGLLFTVDDLFGAPMCAWKAGSASATLALHDMAGGAQVTLGGLDRTLVAFVDGAVDASQLIVEGAFNDTATLVVTMAWTSEQGDEFSVQRNVSLRVRPCFEHEYVQDGVCRTCSDGSLIQDPVSDDRVHSRSCETCGAISPSIDARRGSVG
jgi:predicted outer membrane repeat protein